jgi:hypothetical protein
VNIINPHTALPLFGNYRPSLASYLDTVLPLFEMVQLNSSIYLRAELNSQRPTTESARIQTTVITRQTQDKIKITIEETTK